MLGGEQPQGRNHRLYKQEAARRKPRAGRLN
jgi:hypothetical protein